MQLRSFYSVIFGVVILLLSVAAIGFYWLFAQSPLGLISSGQTVTPDAAMFVSKQAPVMVSLLVNLEQLETFRLVTVPAGKRRQARAELNQFKQSLLANTELDYGRDVQPWLGQELTLAITTLDIDRDPVNGEQPGYLLAVATNDPQQSREFLQLFWQKRAIAGTDLMFEQYKGVKLIYGSTVAIDPAPTNRQTSTTKHQASLPSPAALLATHSLATAVVGDRFVLFANHPKVLRDAINNVQAPGLNLSTADFYNQALETLPQSRIGLSFVNLSGVAEWVSTDTGDTTKQSKPNTHPLTDRTLAVSVALNRHGLLAETALLTNQTGNQTTMVPATLSEPVEALQYIPGDSPVVASGTNLNRLWSGLTDDVKGYETISHLLNQPLQDLQDRWQIDLSNDIFRWVTGEYALGLLPSANGQSDFAPAGKGRKSKTQNAKPLSGDWIFVAQRPSTDAAKQAIAHLDEVARNQKLSVGPVNLENQTVSTWTRLKAAGKRDAVPNGLQAEVQGVHATVGNYEIFTTSIAAMDRALKTGDATLTNRTPFQQAIASLPTPNNGYLYLDWKTAQPLLEQRIPLLKVIELAGKPLLDHLRSLTISSFGRNGGIQRGGIFIDLS